MTLIDGKSIAADIRGELKAKIDTLKGRPPGLTVLLVGDDPASHTYVRMKKRACEEVGIHSVVKELPASLSEVELLAHIDRLNGDETVDAILVQLPLPPQIDEAKVLLRLDPKKDVDGFHPINVGHLLTGDPTARVPCTPKGVHELLLRTGHDPSGKRVTIVGRSNIVGKPLAALLMQKRTGCNATVTLAHSRTRDLKQICQEADILVAALGQPHFITPDYVKEGQVVIDVGITYVLDDTHPRGKRMVGDVLFDEVKHKVAAITPVPGGVGPMTVAMLLLNTWQCYHS